MAKIRDFLSATDYKNYRNVRAAAAMFVVLGAILLLAGMGLMLVEADAHHPPPRFVGFILFLFGLTGAIGGVAVFLANRSWSRLAYVMAGVYVLAFPLGTILSVIMFMGLGRYLESVARFRAARQR